MRVSFLVIVAASLLSLSGCGGGSGEGTATSRDELDQFLIDNPEIANEEDPFLAAGK